MKSMTGFGKAMTANETLQVDVEIKSVNHRFLDMQLRMPKECNPYEADVRKQIKDTLQRGRIEVYVSLTRRAEGGKEVQVNWQLVDQLVAAFDTRFSQLPGKNLDLTQLLNGLVLRPDFIEVVEEQAADPELPELLAAAIQEALGNLQAARQQEGDGIQTILSQYSQEILRQLADLNQLNTVIEEQHRERLTQKVTELLGEQVDQARLLTEVTLLIERGDIHEELDRLAIHVQKLQKLLQEEGAIGRELDFLIQEMNREVNTTGSKSTAIAIKDHVVTLKTLLEKIREQVQNIE